MIYWFPLIPQLIAESEANNIRRYFGLIADCYTGKALLQQTLVGLGNLSTIVFMPAMTIPCELTSLN